ncbi:MAG: ThiF family adenylyltransferase [Promethearchaeota archaeon]
MFDNKKLKNWSKSYWNHINRNIGIITVGEQEKLRKTSIAILGVGGLGGPLVEQLVRTGCENLLICDNGKFEVSNLNRQICIRKDIGKYKVDVIKRLLKNINPEMKLKTFKEININNISNILNNISIVALTLDDPITSILIARECYRNNISMLESWAIPYLCGWWFTEKSVDYETFYGLKTHEKPIQEIIDSKDLVFEIRKAFLNKLKQFPSIEEKFDREKGALNKLLSGRIPSISFAPIVRLSASYLAYEIVFTGVLKVKEMILAPNIIGYDYFNMEPLNFSLV